MSNKNQFELKCSGEKYPSKDNWNLRNFNNYHKAKLTSPEEEKKESVGKLSYLFMFIHADRSKLLSILALFYNPNLFLVKK